MSNPQCEALYEMTRLTVLSSHDVEYVLVRGLSQGLVVQLKAYSSDLTDTVLQDATSDYERFGVGDYEAWYAKQRVPYALIDGATETLAALIWFGPKTLGRPSLKHLTEEERSHELSHATGEWHTVSYRAYGVYRGRRLMSIFSKVALADYLTRYPGAKLWLSIDTQNPASFALSERLGFERSEEYTDETRHHYVYIYKQHG